MPAAYPNLQVAEQQQASDRGVHARGCYLLPHTVRVVFVLNFVVS